MGGPKTGFTVTLLRLLLQHTLSLHESHSCHWFSFCWFFHWYTPIVAGSLMLTESLCRRAQSKHYTVYFGVLRQSQIAFGSFIVGVVLQQTQQARLANLRKLRTFWIADTQVCRLTSTPIQLEWFFFTCTALSMLLTIPCALLAWVTVETRQANRNKKVKRSDCIAARWWIHLFVLSQMIQTSAGVHSQHFRITQTTGFATIRLLSSMLSNISIIHRFRLALGPSRWPITCSLAPYIG